MAAIPKYPTTSAKNPAGIWALNIRVRNIDPRRVETDVPKYHQCGWRSKTIVS
jgi:hypothetical protein